LAPDSLVIHQLSARFLLSDGYRCSPRSYRPFSPPFLGSMKTRDDSHRKPQMKATSRRKGQRNQPAYHRGCFWPEEHPNTKARLRADRIVLLISFIFLTSSDQKTLARRNVCRGFLPDSYTIPTLTPMKRAAAKIEANRKEDPRSEPDRDPNSWLIEAKLDEDVINWETVRLDFRTNEIEAEIVESSMADAQRPFVLAINPRSKRGTSFTSIFGSRTRAESSQREERVSGLPGSSRPYWFEF